MMAQFLVFLCLSATTLFVTASQFGLFLKSDLLNNPSTQPQFLVIKAPMNPWNNIGPSMQCAILCQGCHIFEVIDGFCALYKRISETNPPEPDPVITSGFKIHPKGQLPSKFWLLVFRLNSSDETFWPRDVVALNKDDPIAEKYSILDEMEDYKDQDSHFQFKLCYPGLSTSSCYRWSQSDNPLDITGQTKPSDFVYMSGPFPKHVHFHASVATSTSLRAILTPRLA
ncbi:hypothetical protein TCAL_09069 [Tigriopus californicus]|uniref:Uncharacterized protein n=1 Tax=Tigriopus californicus TaxID=6832 RepID=A0A553NR31_TIGCA|nr:hypothetical protein TCAL_09069 [Tigriopus californicus]